MGFWGVLLELARAVVPHAAPHVARAVVDAAKERRAASSGANSSRAAQPTNETLAEAINYLERRLNAADEKTAELDERLAASQRETAARWQSARKLVLALIGWNVGITAALIGVVIYILIRR